MRTPPPDAPLPAGAEALAEELADYAIAQLRTNAGPFQETDIATKAHAADLVTDVDRALESYVRERIGQLFADHRIVGEEFGETGPPAASHTWWIDPVDGTTNFAHGIGWHSFSLALTVDGVPVLGFVADPSRNEVYRAVSAPGSLPTVAGSVARVAPTDRLAGTVVCTEWLAHVPWDGMPEMLDGLAAAHSTVRIMGSSALSLAQVAAGRAAAAAIGRFSPIDDLAAAFIAVRAGAQVISVDGSLFPPTGGIAVAAPGVADQLRALLPRTWAADAKACPQ